MRRIFSAPQRIRKHQENSEGDGDGDLSREPRPRRQHVPAQVVRSAEIRDDVEDELDGGDEQDETLAPSRHGWRDENSRQDGYPQPRPVQSPREKAPELGS